MTTAFLVLLCTALALQALRARSYRKLAELRGVRAQIAEQQLAVFYGRNHPSVRQHY